MISERSEPEPTTVECETCDGTGGVFPYGDFGEEAEICPKCNGEGVVDLPVQRVDEPE